MQNHVNPTLEYFVILMFESILSLSVLPSWMVKAIGLRVKSGWLVPSGSVSINCVIITPGTLDFFLIPTVSIGKWNVSDNKCDTWKEKRMKNMIVIISSFQNLLLFCNQIITHINHAETHSNTWNIRMFNVYRHWIYTVHTEFGSGVDGSLVSMHIYISIRFIFVAFFLRNPCLTDM